jgi:hypothetical protein
MTPLQHPSNLLQNFINLPLISRERKAMGIILSEESGKPFSKSFSSVCAGIHAGTKL